MDEIKDLLQTQLAGTIDFAGQRFFDQLSSIAIYGGVALSVLIAFVKQDFEFVWWGIIATYSASLVLSLPLPCYRRNPVVWRDPRKVDLKDIKIDL